MGGARGRVRVGGVAVDALSEAQVVARVMAALHRGDGGHVVTPNVDICRRAARDPDARDLIRRADIVVADGMPLVWAARLRGTPLPGRVTGADLIWSLSAAAARYGFPVYLLGGAPGVPQAAARALTRRFPGLRVAGTDAPPHGFDTCPEGIARVRAALTAAAPRVVFVGLGFPKQDRLITTLREDLPRAWFVGCGAAIAFAAGTVPRAPMWMRRTGLEWAFRLATEPLRLSRRYLIDDLPYAVHLLARSLAARCVTATRSGHGPG